MAKLIYSAFTSLNVYVADEKGNFDWAELYEAIWRVVEKIVDSATLRAVFTAKTRRVRSFDVDAVRELKAGAKSDLEIGGSELASHAIRAGLVDEYHLLIVPVIAGGGNRYLPDKVSVKLKLLDERRFDNGLVYVRYQAKR
jgi:dihydrofolate reductase